MSNKQRLITANTKFDQQLIKMINELEEQRPLVLPEGANVWKKSLLQTTTCRVYATLASRTSNSQTYKINLEGDTSIFTFDKIIGKKIARITNTNAGVYAEYSVKSTTRATQKSSDGSSSEVNATWNESAKTYKINAAWGTNNPISNLMDTTISDTVTLAETFVVDDNPSAYPSNGYHTDGYYYELLGSVTSANVMSLSDGALEQVEMAVINEIVEEVSA